MTRIRTSATNVLLLGALLLPVLASCGGGSTGTTPPAPSNPVVTQPPVTPPVTTPPIVQPPVTPPVTTPGNLPPVAITIDRPNITLVEKANVPPQTFILSINRTADQVFGLHLGNPNLRDPNAPGVGPTGAPEVKNGTTTWYMAVDAQGALQGDYTFSLNILDNLGNVIGSTTLQTKVTHDLRLESDLNTWVPNERQVLAFVNEVRTKGTLNGDANAVNGTCAAGVGPLRALLPSSVAYLAARGHANWFATYGYTAHVELDHNAASFYGETLTDRLARAEKAVGTAVNFGPYGENAAAGQTSPLEVMKAWLNSPTHCANIMRTRYTHMGVGYAAAPSYQAKATGDIYKDSWVQNFVTY